MAYIDVLSSRLASTTLSETVRCSNWARTRIVRNVHKDDIHAVVKLNDSLVTGSKDGCVRLWSLRGDHKMDIMLSQIDYKKWTTALCALSDGALASGSRDGTLRIWGPGFKNCAAIAMQHTTATNCKDRNQHRINCITQSPDNMQGLLVGRPTSIMEWDIGRKCVRWEQQVSANDWVYTVDHVAGDRLLVTVGCELSTWTRTETGLTRTSSVITETRAPRNRKQRPFISSVTKLRSGLVACTLFTGELVAADVERSRVVVRMSAHTGRAWCGVDINGMLASGGDDGVVRAWDVRTCRCVSVSGYHDGRVSNLSGISDTSVMTTSCPDSCTASNGACLTYWDTRM